MLFAKRRIRVGYLPDGELKYAFCMLITLWSAEINYKGNIYIGHTVCYNVYEVKIMDAEAIIFDKDGTLLDFDAFWVTVSVNALKEVLKHFEKENVPVEEILECLGVHDGVTDVDGVLCKGTYRQMGEKVYDVLCRYGCGASCDDVTDAVISAYNNNADSGEIKPNSPKLAEVLTRLKKDGKKLAVVTMDNEEITRKCLKRLGIIDLFDKVYTDDGHTPVKPNPNAAIEFCKVIGVQRERTVMVGDTLTDAKFAKNAEIGFIGVAKSDKSKAILSPYANAVVSDLSEILNLLK